MKMLLINGSPHEAGCTYTALREVETTLQAAGVETELYWIGNQPISGCRGCWACKKTGRCVMDDQVNEIADRLSEFDGIVVGSPVYYAGPAGQLCALLDRLFYSCGAKKMAGKVAAAVVSCRRGGASAAFDRLNKYFTICNMAVIGSQYWNQVHGNKPEEVLQDEEGLQTMRTLARNIAYWLQAKEAAKNAGVVLPEPEPRRSTNFIR